MIVTEREKREDGNREGEKKEEEKKKEKREEENSSLEKMTRKMSFQVSQPGLNSFAFSKDTEKLKLNANKSSLLHVFVACKEDFS